MGCHLHLPALDQIRVAVLAPMVGQQRLQMARLLCLRLLARVRCQASLAMRHRRMGWYCHLQARQASFLVDRFRGCQDHHRRLTG